MGEKPGYEPLDESNIDKDSLTGKLSRRKFLGDFSKAFVGAVALGAAKKTGDYLGEEIFGGPELNEYGIENLESIKEFRNLGEGALVICANDVEFKTAVNLLKASGVSEERTRNRSRFDVRKNSANKTYEAVVPVKKYEDKDTGPGERPHGTDTIRVVLISIDNPVLQNLGSNYGIVQLRGHTSDMPTLLEKFKTHRADHSILIMGGCEAVQFMKEQHSPQTAIVAGRMGVQANSVQNNFNLLTILDNARIQDSWEELNTKLHQASDNIQNYAIVPGDPQYYAYASGKSPDLPQDVEQTSQE